MKNPYKKINKSKLSFGELVAALSSCSQNEHEAVAALLDMLASGRVKIKDHGHFKRIRFSL